MGLDKYCDELDRFEAKACKAMVDFAEKNTKDFMKKMGSALVCEKKKPTPEQLKAVRKQAAELEKRLKKENPGFDISVDLGHKIVKGKLELVPVVTGHARRTSMGGGTHKIAKGETLSGIAKKYYGNACYWPIIAEANPTKVKSGGDFIIAGNTLQIPKRDLPPSGKLADAAAQIGGSGAAANKKAALVAPPVVGCEVDKSKTKHTQRYAIPGGFGDMIVTVTVSGSVEVADSVPVDSKFKLEKHKFDAAKAAQSKAKEVKFSLPEVTLKRDKKDSAKVTLEGDAELTIAGATKKRKIMTDGKVYKYEETHFVGGSVGSKKVAGELIVTIEITFRLKWPEWAKDLLKVLQIVGILILILILVVLVALIKAAPAWVIATIAGMLIYGTAQAKDPDGLKALEKGH